MGSIADLDVYLFFAIQSTVIALSLLIILWSARGIAVYLFLLSELFSALHYMTFPYAEAGKAGFGLMGT